MTLDAVLDALYASEINFAVSCFWDNGIDVKIGDEMNGIDAESNVATAAQAAAWFDREARRVYPHSKYAKEFRGITVDVVPAVVEALKAEDRLIEQAQAILAAHLEPGGADAPATIERLVALLDGSKQRAAQDAARLALAAAKEFRG